MLCRRGSDLDKKGWNNMSPSVLIALCILAIVISIVAGFKKGSNVGMLGFGFAYIIGCLLMGLKPKEVIGFFPYSIVFMMIGITFFFGFAIENGTVKAMADRVVYLSKGKTWLITPIIFLAGMVVAGAGMSAGASMVLAPIVFPISSACGLNPCLSVVALNAGALVGSDFPWCNGGTVLRGVLESIGYGESAYDWNWKLLILHAISLIISTLIFFVFFKGWKSKNGVTQVTLEKPAPMTPIQKKNFTLIIILVCLVFIPNILKLFMPKSAPIKWMTTNLDNRMLVYILGAICALLGLGDEKQVIRKRIPWPTILTVAGISTLMAVATKAGVVDMLATLISGGIPRILIGAMLCLFAGILSFFSGGLNVVLPMLATLVPGIVEATGLNPLMLVTSIFAGAMATTCSPFSQGGANMLAGFSDDEERAKVTLWLMPVACILCLISCIWAIIGGFSFFPA